MRAKFFLMLEVIVLLVFGLSFIIDAQWSMSLFGLTLDQGGIVMTQLVGAGFVSIAILDWFARNVNVYGDAFPVLMANFFMNAIGFVVLLVHKLAGLGNNWTWIPIALYLLFALAFGYCLLVKSSIETRIVRPRHA
ncbi:hypothetical protein [Candidatus Leptofilum sp.]|uniref:hypothetical protein n=1 Tax=Candidatus Leptofilum sp. TaxID=3241576 RepID=UPI003B5C9223